MDGKSGNVGYSSAHDKKIQVIAQGGIAAGTKINLKVKGKLILKGALIEGIGEIEADGLEAFDIEVMDKHDAMDLGMNLIPRTIVPGATGFTLDHVDPAPGVIHSVIGPDIKLNIKKAVSKNPERDPSNAREMFEPVNGHWRIPFFYINFDRLHEINQQWQEAHAANNREKQQKAEAAIEEEIRRAQEKEQEEREAARKDLERKPTVAEPEEATNQTPSQPPANEQSSSEQPTQNKSDDPPVNEQVKDDLSIMVISHDKVATSEQSDQQAQPKQITFAVPQEKVQNPDAALQDILNSPELAPWFKLGKVTFDKPSGHYLYNFDLNPTFDQNSPTAHAMLQQNIVQYFGKYKDINVQMLRHVEQGGLGFFEGFTGSDLRDTLPPKTVGEQTQRNLNRKLGALAGIHALLQSLRTTMDKLNDKFDPDAFKAVGSTVTALASAYPLVTAAGIVICVAGVCYLAYQNSMNGGGDNGHKVERPQECYPSTSADDNWTLNKLEKYILNFEHPQGASKAKWFDRALGFNKSNMNELAKQLKFDLSKAVQTEVTEYGVKYNQIIKINGANGRTIDVKTAWIKNNDGIIRFITATPGD